MNKQRRKTLADIATRVDALKGVAILSFDELKKIQPMLLTAVSEIESVQEDEEEAFDNKPEALQEQAQDAYDSFVDNVENAINLLNSLGDLTDIEYDANDVEGDFDGIADYLNDAQD